MTNTENKYWKERSRNKMARNHLRRITMPTTWSTVEKKRVYWVARSNSGAHPLDKSMPLVLFLREVLKYGDTSREVKQILNHKNVLIDGVRRKDHRYNVGLMDVVSIPDLKEDFRVSLNKNGRLTLVKIDSKEAKEKVCKIRGKGICKGKTQLRLSDGRTILLDKKSDYKTSDSVIISVPDQKISSHLKFEKGALVLLTDGKRRGVLGTVEEIKGNFVKIKSKDKEFETLKNYCLVVGKGKASLTVE